jgi:hypothetical protein
MKTIAGDSFVKNPVLKYTYFTCVKELDRVEFGVIDTHSKKESRVLVDQAKQELNLSSLDFFFFAGRCGLYLKPDELHRIYEVVAWLISHGHPVQMQDGTRVVFKVGDEVNAVGQQKKLFDALDQAAINIQSDAFFVMQRVPAHRDVFWDIPEGRELAKRLRERFDLKNELDKDHMLISEYLEEVQQQ